MWGRSPVNNKPAFDLMQDSFARAAAAYPRGVSESCYTLAGQLAHFRIVGRSLTERLHQAFAHLEKSRSTMGQPQLTIETWDCGETGIEPPGACALLTNNLVHLSEIAAYRFQRTFVLFNRISRRMIGCVANAGELSLY